MPTPERPSPPRPRSVLGGPLLLAATLFVATICAGLTVIWLLDRSSDPGPWAAVVVVTAIVATVASAYAEGTWSARITRTTELGNATRLLAVAAVLLVIPTMILQVIDEEAELEPRGTAAACPEGEVPAAAFEDVEAGSDEAELASCLRWWGLLAPEAVAFSGTDTVLRGEMASLLDRLVAAGGAPLPEAPEVAVPDPASPDAGAIARVQAAGLMGSGDPATFAPGDPIPRDQLATVVARAHRHVTGAPLPEGDPGRYTDIEGNVHADNIGAAAAAGIVVAVDDGVFEPGAASSRAQVGTILARTLDLWVTDGITALPG
jgi:hypothetical protein